MIVIFALWRGPNGLIEWRPPGRLDGVIAECGSSVGSKKDRNKKQRFSFSWRKRVVTMPTHLEQFQKGGGQAHPDWQAPHWPDYPEEECNPVGQKKGRCETHWHAGSACGRWMSSACLKLLSLHCTGLWATVQQREVMMMEGGMTQ